MAVQRLAVGAAPGEPTLRLDDIQGDVLVGLQKDAECFVFFAITDVVVFQQNVRDQVCHVITSTTEVVRREAQIAAAKAAGSTGRLPITGVNLGFTAAGLTKLTGLNLATVAGLDPAFANGASTRANGLGDDLGAWKDPFQAPGPDGVFLVTARTAPEADAAASAVVQGLGSSIAVVWRETGATRPQRGHEHFGFLDGVSQPGVRGLTQRMNPANPDQGLPGQELVWPGEFVFDYPGQPEPAADGSTRKEHQGPNVDPPLAWMRDGSYMVWRRLEQKVLAFRAAVAAESDKLGMDRELVAARMVGRWPSGAPISVAPLQDEPALGADPMKNNDFDFAIDAHQRRCPYAAHIRKTYPRDDLNDAGPPSLAGKAGEASVQTRRLRRAGIPFGPELRDGEAVGTEASRGLMFVCYQTSITDQFEFVQRSWANNPDFVFGKQRPGGGPVTPGHDPIIGQAGGARTMDEPLPNYPAGSLRSTLDLTTQFVDSTGAGYFFMPSLPALRSGPLVGT